MQFRKISRALVAAAAVFGLAFAAPACMSSGRGALYVTSASPPPPRYVEEPHRPGYVYIQGRWDNYNNGYVWREGYYVRERPGQVFVQGRWYADGGRWRWRDGYWDSRGYRERPYRRRHVNDYHPR
jgi:hypothetical protein